MWYDIKDFEGYYQVDENGSVRSLDRHIVRKDNETRFMKGKILSPNIGTNGYYYVVLSKEGKTKTCYIHKLVGYNILTKPSTVCEIDHINGNKLDNRVVNLRWIDRHSNASKGSLGKHKDNGMGKNPKAKKVFCYTTGEEFGCIREFAEKYGINYSTIKSKIKRGERIFNGYGIDIAS